MKAWRPGNPDKRPASEVFQVPRLAFVWLLAAVVAVIVPHVGRLPLWLTLLCALCIGVRILIYQGRLAFPGNRLKLLLLVLIAALVPLQYGRELFSTDAMVAVLLAGITLKLLEMRQRRDVLLVLYLCFFTVVAEFIYSQSILVALYMALAVLLTTSALLALHQEPQSQTPLRTLKLSGLLLLQSVPLMLAFFVLLPRIAPLWSVPMQTGEGTTGLSDTMAPGDIGNLIRSAELAFRVQFQGRVPPNSELYWRALTLDRFDGRQWQQDRGVTMSRMLAPALETQPWYRDIEVLGEPVDYNVILEPTFRSWIFTLQVPRFQDERMLLRSDHQVLSRRPVSQRFSYDARSYLDYRAEIGTEGGAQRRARLLPDAGNARARDFARALRASVGDDAAYIDAVLAYFREEAFFYTPSPPLLADDSVDAFLFDTREGFCEHFAGSFTFLMRAADIPARVVTGYQGGELNPYDGTVTVRQYDAHAWSEVWLPDSGWIRVDPTSAVAPERINLGSNVVYQTQDSFLGDEGFTLMRFRNSQLLNELRLRLEMLDYTWSRFVLNYDQDMQLQLLTRLFGGLDRLQLGLIVVAILVLVTASLALFLLRSRSVPGRSPALVQYQRFCRHLAQLGYPRRRGETPRQYLERLGKANPRWLPLLHRVTDQFVALTFEGREADAASLRELRQSVSLFRSQN